MPTSRRAATVAVHVLSWVLLQTEGRLRKLKATYSESKGELDREVEHLQPASAELCLQAKLLEIAKRETALVQEEVDRQVRCWAGPQW